LLFFSFLSIYISLTILSTLSLHDALPILAISPGSYRLTFRATVRKPFGHKVVSDEIAIVDRIVACRLIGSRVGGGAVKPSAKASDRKSTRLNSSHQIISYAVFCLKKKKKK